MNNRSLRVILFAPFVAMAILFASAGAALAVTPSGPYRQQTTPTEEHLHGIFAFDTCHAWAVGEETGDGITNPTAQSSAIATVDGGKTWTKQSFPTGSALRTTMNRVFFTDASKGYAAGEANDVTQQPGLATRPGSRQVALLAPNFLVTSDGGNTWVDKSANLPPETKNDGNGAADIEGLTAVGDQVWIASEVDSSTRTGLISHSANRGATWTVQKTLTDAGFASISMFDSNNGFAVSDAAAGGSPTGTGQLWRTTNGGLNWTSLGSTIIGPEGVWATGDSTAVIVEESGHIEYSDGSALFPANLPVSVGTSDLLDVAFGGGLNGLASGELGGSLLETSDGGRNWTIQTANAGTNNFNGVTMAKGTTNSFVTGESGVVSANTDVSKGCAVASTQPASASPTPVPNLPATGRGSSFDAALWISGLFGALVGGAGAWASSALIRRRL